MLTTRTLKLAAWIICAVTTALAVCRLVLAIVEPEAAKSAGDANAFGGGVGLAVLEALVLMAFGALSMVVTSRQPRNPVGWLLGLIPLSFGILLVSDRLYWHLALTNGEMSGVAAYAAWLASWVWIPAMVPALTLFPLLFPTGRPLSPRWRALAWTAVATGTVMFVGTAFVTGPLEQYPAVVNPLGIDSAAVKVAGVAGFALWVPTTLASLASLAVRFRRSHGAERQQVKWVAAAAALFLVIFALPLDEVAGTSPNVAFASLQVGLLIVAAAVTVAMLRYRLYDIDVVINRTLVYAALSVTLAATYLVSVLLLQLALSGVTAGNGLAVAASTLAAAALFQPARRRIQATVDRRFFRRKYDAIRTVERFAAQLRDQVDVDALGTELRTTVVETMQPQHVSLWLRER